MPEDREAASADRVLKPGQRVYDEAGQVIGVIQAITDIGVEVNTDSDVETLSLRQSPSVNLGEGYLVWRCSECGELGDINQIPDHCPSCGASEDTLYAYLED
jgi:rubrerythrin